MNLMALQNTPILYFKFPTLGNNNIPDAGTCGVGVTFAALNLLSRNDVGLR
jgi:hypothetical protein